ncbi:MAG: putative zeta toxin protein [Microbacteriaceae bacterium]|nr:putative zeta toxin protein [Microbacteriaceae bacterium]
MVTAGSPGAGKSTALHDIGFETIGFRDIDPDRIKTLLLRDALNDGTFDDLLRRRLADGRAVRPMELASLVHRESTIIAHNVAEISMHQGDNVIIQGTLGWDEQPQRLLDVLDLHEYADLTILDVEVDQATALERVLERWWVGRNNPADPLGGRFVPSDVVRGLYVTDTLSRCQANAEIMFELSVRMTTELRTSSTIHGVTSQTIRRLDTGHGRMVVPSFDDD